MKSHYLRIDLNDHAVLDDIQSTLKKHDHLVTSPTTENQPSELRWTGPEVWTITLGRLTHAQFNKNQQKEVDKIIQGVFEKHEPLLIEFSGEVYIEYRTAAFEIVSKKLEALQQALQTALDKAGYKFSFQAPRITFAIKTSDFKEEEKAGLQAVAQELKNKKYKESLYSVNRFSGSQLAANYELGKTSKKLSY